MTGFGALGITAGEQSLQLQNVAVSFNEPGGTEVLVWFEPPADVRLDVYGRDIADGELSCTLGPRQAAVRMDVSLAMRIVTEALRSGLVPPTTEIEALRAALDRGE